MRVLMSLPARHNRYPYAEYVRLEDASSTRHEFWNGEIYAMAGGTPDHARLCAVIARLIGNQLIRGCEVYSSDLRVRIAAADLTTYPDTTVVCGRVVRAIEDRLAATNPVLLVEVTSPSTEDYDRGDKLAAYKHLPTLREVLIASHVEPRLTLHRRETDGSWSVREARAGERVELSSVAASLAVDEVFAGGLEDAPATSR